MSNGSNTNLPVGRRFPTGLFEPDLINLVLGYAIVKESRIPLEIWPKKTA